MTPQASVVTANPGHRGRVGPKLFLGFECAGEGTFLQWGKLTHFLEHATLQLSNNLAENSIRPVALGRKDWIHVGSQQPGKGREIRRKTGPAKDEISRLAS
jgi:hypothetical protein